MAPKRKVFHKLSVKQKRRRILLDIRKYNEIQECSDKAVSSSSEMNISQSNHSDINSNNLQDVSIIAGTSGINEAVGVEVLVSSSPLSSPQYTSGSDIDKCVNQEFNIIENKHDKNEFKVAGEFLTEGLAEWILHEKKVPHKSVDRLLKILGEKFELPKSTKSLIKYSDPLDIMPMGNGNYLHFPDWYSNLMNYYIDQNSSSCNDLNFQEENSNKKLCGLLVNVDGLPIYNNLGVSRYSLYPVLVKIYEYPIKVFCIGIYSTDSFEHKEMPHPDILLKRFFSDMQVLIDSEEVNKGVVVSLKGFICDAPVRSALKGIVSHTGYSSCERCEVHGEYHSNRVVLLKSNCKRRSDSSFINRDDEKHHKCAESNSIEKFGFPMVSGFILDSMHLIYIGIIKKILTMFFSVKVFNKKLRLDRNTKDYFNSKLIQYQDYVPCEFGRKLEGGCTTILKWKASQYRLFGLYVGVVLLRHRKICSKQFHLNFLRLSVALRLLNTPNQTNNIEYIQALLYEFLEKSKDIFGKQFFSYNVHSIIHLPDDYSNFGCLDRVSAFSFESYLGCEVKNSVRGTYKPLVQIGRHVSRMNKLIPSAPSDHSDSKSVKCNHSQNGLCLKSLLIGSITIKPNRKKMADSCIILKCGDIGSVTGIHKLDSQYLLTLELYSKSSFFKKPLDSDLIKVNKIEKSNEIVTICSSQVFAKLLVLPYKSYFVSIPLLQSLSD